MGLEGTFLIEGELGKFISLDEYWFECENTIDTRPVLRGHLLNVLSTQSYQEAYEPRIKHVGKALSKVSVLVAKHAYTCDPPPCCSYLAVLQHQETLVRRHDPFKEYSYIVLFAPNQTKMVSLGSPMVELGGMLSDKLLHFSIARRAASEGSITGGAAGKLVGLE